MFDISGISESIFSNFIFYIIQTLLSLVLGGTGLLF